MKTGVSLRFEGVTRLFGRQQALTDVTLECLPGVVTCLVGPNGGGKSTALALAAGLLPATTGRISLGDRVIRPTVPLPATGYLPQASAYPTPLRVREVLGFTFAARRADDAARAAILGVTGLDEVMNRTVRELSGGWLRRLSIACALVPPTDLLLLDEPFVGLDPETLDRFVDHIGRVASRGAVVLLASHEFDVIDLLSSRVAVLDEGRLIGLDAGGGGSRALYRRMLSGMDMARKQAAEIRKTGIKADVL